MASSVRYAGAGSQSSASNLTITGNCTYWVWVFINPGGYSPPSDTGFFAIGSTGGASEGFLIGVGQGLTNLFAAVFRNGGAEFPQVSPLTGSTSAWVCVAFRKAAGSASVDVSYRLENVTTWNTTTLTLTQQITQAGSIYLGTDQFGELTVDGDIRGFGCQQTVMSDAQLLAATQNINSAPAGTNLHFLPLASAASANTDLGTGGGFTTSGTLQTAATEPTESVPAGPGSLGGRLSPNFRSGSLRLCG